MTKVEVQKIQFLLAINLNLFSLLTTPVEFHFLLSCYMPTCPCLLQLEDPNNETHTLNY
jgi:hypothetical protein